MGVRYMVMAENQTFLSTYCMFTALLLESCVEFGQIRGYKKEENVKDKSETQ